MAVPAPETAAVRLAEFVESNITRDTQVFTDGNYAGKSLDKRETVSRGDVECVREEIHVNGAESFWARVRRGYNGTLGHIKPKRLHRYIN